MEQLIFPHPALISKQLEINKIFISRVANLTYLTACNYMYCGTLAVEDLAQDSGRTLVRAEFGYPKGSPNTNS
jgi:hypothetical protein